MKIVVCIKQVPDTTEVRLDPVKGTLIREGVPSIMNPDDKAALEEALKIKDKETDSTVTVITMGPPQADAILREALAMGADRAILLTDRKFAGADTLATSNALAAALREIPFDLIIAGRQAIDGDTAQVGPQIAEHMGLPQVSYAKEITISADKKSLEIKRVVEDGYYLLDVQLPALVTVLSEANSPRYMHVARIVDVYDMPVETWTVAKVTEGKTPEEAETLEKKLGLQGSPTQVYKSFPKQLKPAGEVYDNLDEKAAVAKIVEKLKERHII
jgi:electron transfer flavoprotein beta subunit